MQTYGFEIDPELYLSSANGVNDGVYVLCGTGFEVSVDTLVDFNSTNGVNQGVTTRIGYGYEYNVDVECGSESKPISDWTVYQAGSPGYTLGVLGILWDAGDDSVEIIFTGYLEVKYAIDRDPRGDLRVWQDCKFIPVLLFIHFEFE